MRPAHAAGSRRCHRARRASREGGRRPGAPGELSFLRRAGAARGAELLLCVPAAAPRRAGGRCVRLYAFLRHTDDLADEPGPAEQKAGRSSRGGTRCDAALAGDAGAWPGLPALADTVARHAIPAHLLHEVIEGVSMDIQPRGFATFDELADYCYHVASVVGLCCLHIWGYRSEGGKAERLAEHCGLALQLTNILRDVRDDAARRPDLPAPRGPGAVRRRARGADGRRPARRSRPRAAGLRGRAAPTNSTRTPADSSRWSTPSAGRCSGPSSASTAPCSTRSPAAITTSSTAGSRWPPGARSPSR